MDEKQFLSKEDSGIKDIPDSDYRVELVSRYYSKIADILDTVSYYLMHYWTTSLSYCISCYMRRNDDRFQSKRVTEYLFLGPVYICLSILLTPFGIIGSALWYLLCATFNQEKFAYLNIVTDANLATNAGKNSFTEDAKNYTFCSANVLLAPEFICRVNNVINSSTRAEYIGQAILNHNGKHLHNLEVNEKSYKISSRSKSIQAEFPVIDFLCLQEVWERSYALILIDKLKEEFNSFIYDVGEFSWSVNRCLLGSGLMFASKKPILTADFKTFTYRTRHAKYTSQGVLCVKILLEDLGLYRRVGFLSNLHTQAFQGIEPVIPRQVTEAYVFIHMFRHRNTEKIDIVDFDIICGDFNSDNMSPADTDIQYHPIFKEYQDICIESPGKDHHWAIGTEMRQATLHLPEVADPEELRKALIDNSRRRKYLLDADVVVHDHHLRTSVVDTDVNDFIRPVAWGGMRRIDRILHNVNTFGSKPVGYCFVTALTNLTDHLPVCLTVGTK